MDKRLSQLLKLASRTGDRLIVLPEGGEEPFVILPIKEYEQAVSQQRHNDTPVSRPHPNAGSVQQMSGDAAEASMLADNYEFEPVAYEESGEESLGGQK